MSLVHEFLDKLTPEQLLQRLRLALEGTNLGIWDWDLRDNSVQFDVRWCEMLGLEHATTKMELSTWQERVHPSDLAACYVDINAHIQGKTAGYENIHRMRHSNGDWVYILDRGRISGRDETGTPIRFTGTHSDVTAFERTKQALRMSLKEQEVLLQEIHHRVKNNLQIVSSLINLQIAQLGPSLGRVALAECQNRILTIARIHENLYQSRNYGRVEFSEYVRGLVSGVFQFAETSQADVRLTFELEDVALSLDQAIPCGLILNELVTNAAKHAFPPGKSGNLQVRVQKLDQGNVLVAVSDDGVGLPLGHDERSTESLGSQIVAALVEQIGGKLEVSRTPVTSFRITFPAN